MMINGAEIPVSKACSGLGICRSGYYKMQDANANEPDFGARCSIQEIALEYPYYGYRRITAEMHRRSQSINHKKVLRIMRENNLLCVRKKFKVVTTDSNHGLPVFPNLVKDIEITRLNHVWVSDITYIQLQREYVYLAVVIDRFSRKCIGWELGRKIDAVLAVNALKMAISERKSLGICGLIHHSDQGVQYASHEYTDLLREYGIIISMSRRGNPYDNAFAETFMKTLKSEEVYMNEYRTFDEAYANIKQFIEKVYNSKRLHSSIGYVPPNEFEMKVLNNFEA
jgi:transposase InsO family protein